MNDTVLTLCIHYPTEYSLVPDRADLSTSRFPEIRKARLSKVKSLAQGQGAQK